MTSRDSDAGGSHARGASGGPLPERLPGLSAAVVVVVVLALVAAPAAGTALDGPAVPAPTSQADAPGPGEGSGNGPPGDGGDGGSGNGDGQNAPGDGGDGGSGNGDGQNAPGDGGDGGSGNGDGAGSDQGPSGDDEGEAGGSNGGAGGPSDGGQGDGGPDDGESDRSNAGGAGADDDDDDDDDDSPGRSDAARGNGPPEDGERGPPDGNDRGTERGPPADRGPTVEVTRGPPSGADDRADDARGPPDDRGDGPPTSVVSVAVSGAESGDQVSLDVAPGPSAAGPVAFDEVSLTVRRDGDFTMRVISSREPLAGSPAFEPGDGADDLGRVRLDHSIANEDVSSVSFDVRVGKSRLRTTGADVEDVALYRFADGGWTPLPTEVVGETGDSYLLRVDSPGLSEFAVGAKRPAFEAYRVESSDRSVEPGEAVRFSARVTNVGGASGVYRARLVVDGEVVDVRHVTVAAGGTRQVNFRRTFERPGRHAVRVGGTGGVAVVVGDDAGPAGEASVGRYSSLVLDRVAAGFRAMWTPWSSIG